MLSSNIAGRVFFAAMVGFSAFLIGWADDLQTLKQKVEFVNSIQADFTQEKHLEMLEHALISKGKLYYKVPRSLRWEYKQPVRSVLLMDKGEIRRFVRTDTGMKEQTGQGLEAMRVFLEEICLWMQGEFGANPDFEAKMKPGRKVVLEPRDQAMADVIRQIELRLTNEPGVIGSVVINEGAGSYTLVRFHNTMINQEIGNSVFQKLNP